MSEQRRCPRCEIALTTHLVGSISVEACARCGGVFFDIGELGRAIRSSSLEAIESEARPAAQGVVLTESRGCLCPACREPMATYRYLNSSPVVLDACPRCSGVWADDGELHAMAQLADRHVPSAARPTSQEALRAGAALDAMAEANRRRARTMVRAIGFLNHSMYPGLFGTKWC